MPPAKNAVVFCDGGQRCGVSSVASLLGLSSLIEADVISPAARAAAARRRSPARRSLALILAAGIYEFLTYVVRRRRKELGIRVALGARRADLWTMILSEGLKMVVAGAIGSLLLIPVGGWLLQAFLYNVKAFDLLTIRRRARGSVECLVPRQSRPGAVRDTG